MSQAFALLGERLRVALDRPDAPALIKIGTLLGIGQEGEFIIEDDMGFVWYGWPVDGTQ